MSAAAAPGTIAVVRFGTQVCGSLAEGATREWLVADGRGGYAMGTVCGLRTRRYHGLLVVADPTPARRAMALASLDPVLLLPGGARVRLATHEWASGAVDPRGHVHLERFDLTEGLPRWRWRVGDVVLERELAMRHGHPSLAVVHRLVAGGPVSLAVHALGTWRDAHGERYADRPLAVRRTADGAEVESRYRIAGPGFVPDGQWWRGAYHREEAARGLNPTEDLCHVGFFSADLDAPGAAMEIVAWAGDPADLAVRPPPATETIEAARRRARAVIAAARPADEAEAALALAADAFVVAGPAGPDVVAGYPWFGSWSRDTMTAYEGLFLCTGRTAEGLALLRAYAETLSEGMLANTADVGHTAYNTADATLWFPHAVERHVAATGDLDLADDLAGALAAIVRHHLAGTRFGIRVDPADGLLCQGADGYALTWMDAVVDGEPVTARRGKAVELNALWINGLAAVATLDERTGRDSTDLRRWHTLARASFGKRFPLPTGVLRDTVDPEDVRLRPNQLLAFGLPYAPMTADPRTLRAIGAALLTPLGLRTLAPGEPGYRGTHRGSPRERDEAYHQGTVWPWLIGPYADACRRSAVDTPGLLDGLVAHLGEWGLGSVSETAEGDPPHVATGCPFQAWSVAEVLRTLMLRRRAPVED
jgi:predicted glycogen debranching enzyme